MKYFQHDTDSLLNKKMRKVVRTHGATGYAIWWATLEELYKADDKGFQVEADDLWLEGLAESLCLSDYRTLTRVFDTFAQIGLISPQLWADNYIFVEAIEKRGDQYTKKKAQNAQRQAKFRESQKQAIASATVNQVTDSNALLSVTSEK
ncbi:MAG: DUF4373 domain-containing protein [Leptolyngbyaceae cyanobacterium CSU_1_4]|nr:DUF4373 domain-containing protein [Leptolyngbyaceae cyanobacterium CSU_1_4]